MYIIEIEYWLEYWYINHVLMQGKAISKSSYKCMTNDYY